MIKYAIFDMDGTLFDTEKLFRQSWISTSEKLGIKNSEEIYPKVSGRSLESIKNLFEKEYKGKYDFNDFYKERMDKFHELTKYEIPMKKGCVELLEYLQTEKIPCALATSTGITITKRNLERTGIEKYFSAVVTGDMVENSKPAPDIFIEAGRRIGAVAEETIVVEDSFNGLNGAHKAGMIPVMVVDIMHADDEIRKIIAAECESLLDVKEFVSKVNAD